jgi:hypothetical protein
MDGNRLLNSRCQGQEVVSVPGKLPRAGDGKLGRSFVDHDFGPEQIAFQFQIAEWLMPLSVNREHQVRGEFKLNHEIVDFQSEQPFWSHPQLLRVINIA